MIDVRAVTPVRLPLGTSVRNVSNVDVRSSPVLPLPEGLGDLASDGEMAGFFLLSLERASGAAAEQPLPPDVIYGAHGLRQLDEFPQGRIQNLTREDVAAMGRETLRAFAGDRDVQYLVDARDVPEWARPSGNAPLADSIAHATVVAYDHLEREAVLDVFLAKANRHAVEVSVFARQDAAPTGSFPFANGPLHVETFGIDPVAGLASGLFPPRLPMVIDARVRNDRPLTFSRPMRRLAIFGGLFLLSLIVFAVKS